MSLAAWNSSAEIDFRVVGNFHERGPPLLPREIVERQGITVLFQIAAVRQHLRAGGNRFHDFQNHFFFWQEAGKVATQSFFVQIDESSFVPREIFEPEEQNLVQNRHARGI